MTEDTQSLEQFYSDMVTLSFGREEHLLYFPARDRSAHPDSMGDRLAALLRACHDHERLLLATSIQALMLTTVPPHILQQQCEKIVLGEESEYDTLLLRLEARGYSCEAQVEEKGQVSMRGGIVDVWPPTESLPLRIEFFGSVADSIRTFDPMEQRSLEKRSALLIPPASEQLEEGAGIDPTAYLPSHAGWIWVDREGIEQHAKRYEESMAKVGASDFITPADTLLRPPAATGSLYFTSVPDEKAISIPFDFKPCETLSTVTSGHSLHPDIMEQPRKKWIDELVDQGMRGMRDPRFSEFTRGLRPFLRGLSASGARTQGPADPRRPLVRRIPE